MTLDVSQYQAMSINRFISIIDDQSMARIRVVIDWYRFSTTSSCEDIMTRKGNNTNDGQVGNSRTRATGYILCVEKTEPGSDAGV